MTRQIALGAVIAFAITVLVLSVWEPKSPPPPAPPPPTSRAIDATTFRQNLRSASIKPEAIARTVRTAPPVLLTVDAGAPLP